MIRKLLVISMASLFIFGCKGRDKTTSDSENMSGGGMADSGSVDSSPMTFDAEGSDSGKIPGLSTVYFDYDRAALSSTARETLKANAEWMKKNSKVKIQIEGHTDSRGSIEYNLALGERRANTVRDYLASLGVPSNRMNVISYGEEKPVAQGEDESAYGKNRRANFLPAQ